MKLEVGMYVRFNRGGIKIAKLIENINDSQFWKLDIHQDILEGDILKASYNIIDLIEVGDILHSKYDNEYWTVQEHQGTNERKWIQTEWQVIENEEEFLEQIDEIIIKEQAKGISYKLGNGDE